MSTGSNILSGATTGAAIGSAVPGVGTAIGAVGGALVGGLASIKGGAKQSYKRYVKDQFKNLMSKGTTLSDEERNRIGQTMVDNQNQTQAAQDIGQQRAALAYTGGSPILAGQQKKAAKDLGEANRDIAVKASSQGHKMASALDERRKAEIMQRMGKIADMEGAETKQNIDIALATGDAIAEISKLA